jgi:hypothetical protein
MYQHIVFTSCKFSQIYIVFNLILYLFNEDCRLPMATGGFPQYILCLQVNLNTKQYEIKIDS